MTIATAITAAQGRVADCYTAISNKGGTLPATQDLANMPTAINSIPTDSSKYGCTIDNLLGNVDANGVYISPTGSANIVFTGIKQIGTGIYSGKQMTHLFYNNGTVESVSFPDLESIIITNGLAYSFYGCSQNLSIYLQKLKIISGSSALAFAFYQNQIGDVNFYSLEEVTGANAFNSCFYGNYSSNMNRMEKVYFHKLFNLNASGVFSSCFYYQMKLTDIYFYALTTTSFGSYVDQFNNMFNSYTASTSGNVDIHFPSNLQSTISGLQGYPNFGATAGRVTLLFDLPATN